MPQAIAPAVGASLAGVFTTTAGGIVGSIALSVGAGLLSQALASGSKPGSGIGTQAFSNSPDVRGTVKQATPAQRIVYGRARFGGAFWFYEVDPPYLYVGLVHSVLPISSFDRLFVGEVEVPLDDDGEPIAAPYLVGASTPRLYVSAQDGSSLSQAINPILDADFASLDSDFRLPGCAVTVLKFHYGSDFDEFQDLWGQVQIPDAQWIGQGAPIYDPRDPTHVLPDDLNDPDDLYDAMATWTWTNNAALIQANWAMMPYGLNAGLGRMRWDEIATAADFDDESVPLAGGGVEKRHTINGVVALDQSPLGVMEDMLTANRGFVTPRGGAVEVSSSQPRTPVLTIVDDDILGGFSYRDRKPKRDLVNLVRTRFVSSERNYQDADAPQLKRSDLITADGQQLESSLKLPFTDTHTAAQRIQKAALEEARLGKAISGTFGLRVLGLTEGMVCNFWSELYPEINGIYEVVEWNLSSDLSGIALGLVEYDPDIARDWTASEDEQAFELEVTEV